MKYLFFFLLFAPFFFGFSHNNQQVTRVALVDTGLDVDDIRFKNHICPEVGEDFTGEGLADIHGHGTHVAGLIEQYSGDKNYCLIILKYYSERDPAFINAQQFLRALESLQTYKPDVVNISVNGPVPLSGEKAIFASLPNTKFFTSAGNDGKDLDVLCDTYPACYAKELKNITVVGNKNGRFSNYGSVVGLWIDGNSVESTYPYSLDPTGKHQLTGTSMSTAIATGQYVNKLN